MARLRDVVVDCAHPASLARFWAQALDGYAVAPYDEEELARLRDIGVFDVQDDPSVLVEPLEGGLPRYFFTKVPEPRTVKNRVHLDLTADDPDAELQRLLALGALMLFTVPTQVPEGTRPEHIVLADPEGNEFCLMFQATGS